MSYKKIIPTRMSFQAQTEMEDERNLESLEVI